MAAVLRAQLVTAGLCLALLTTSVTAKDAQGLFTVKGVGAVGCTAYLEAVLAGGESLTPYAGYISGYISAYNEQANGTYEILPWQTMDTVMIVVAQRCQQESALGFGVAMTQIAGLFREQRLRKLPDRVRFGTGTTAVEMYAPVAQQLKVILQERGYLKHANGNTSAAVRAAQKDFGLEATGVPDQAILLRLFYGSEQKGEAD